MNCFEVKEGNTAFYSEGGLLYSADKTVLLRVPQAIEGEVTTISSILTIASNAAYDCSKITSFDASGSSLTQINDNAFCCLGNSSAKATMKLPNTIQKICFRAFYFANIGTGLTVEDNISYLASADGTVYYLIDGTAATGDVTIKDNTRVVSDYAFDNASITSLTMPDTVLSIGIYCFANCSSLTSLTLSNQITVIPNHAFYASGLTSLVVPASVTQIYVSAFYNHSNITLYFMDPDTTGITLTNDTSFGCLFKAYYFYSEDSNTDGKHWHYVNGVPTLWTV